jgi:hypothetical protein
MAFAFLPLVAIKTTSRLQHHELPWLQIMGEGEGIVIAMFS